MHSQDAAKAATSVVRHMENLDFSKDALEFCLGQDLETTETSISTVVQHMCPVCLQLQFCDCLL